MFKYDFRKLFHLKIKTNTFVFYKFCFRTGKCKAALLVRDNDKRPTVTSSVAGDFHLGLEKFEPHFASLTIKSIVLVLKLK